MRIHNRSFLLAFVAMLWCGIMAGGAFAQQTSCEPDKLAQKYPSLVGKTIKIGQDGESPPFSQRDPNNFDNLIGVDADSARAVFACIGVPVTFVTGAWSGLVPAIAAGQIDVMWDTLLYTPERAKSIDFVYYMNSATGIVVAAGNPHGIKSLDDICGLTGTAGLGTTQENMLREQSEKCTAAGKAAVNIVTSTDIPSGMRLIQNNRADLLATNKFLGDAMASSNKAVESAFGIVTGAKLAVGVTKGNSELAKAISDSIATLEQNGQLKTIFGKYGVDYSLVVAPQVLTQ